MSFGSLFLTMESVDGLGKTTQAKILSTYFRDYAKREVLSTKEPGDQFAGSSLGSGIRELLFKNPGAKLMAPGVADLLFLADHVQNSYDINNFLYADWKDGVDSRKVVISDRYADSQFAYAGGQSKRAPNWVLTLYQQRYGEIPDAIIYLRANNIESGWTLDRAKSRKGHEEGKQEGKPWNLVEEQVKIQEAYDRRLFEDSAAKVIKVDVFEEDTIEDVSKNIFRALRSSGKEIASFLEPKV